MYAALLHSLDTTCHTAAAKKAVEEPATASRPPLPRCVGGVIEAVDAASRVLVVRIRQVLYPPAEPEGEPEHLVLAPFAWRITVELGAGCSIWRGDELVDIGEAEPGTPVHLHLLDQEGVPAVIGILLRSA